MEQVRHPVQPSTSHPPGNPERKPGQRCLSTEVFLGEGELEGLLTNPLVTALLDRSSDGIVVIEVETRRILAMNRRARQLLGYCSEEVVGNRCKDTVNSPDCGRRCLINSAMEVPGGGPVGHVLYRGRDRLQELHANTCVILVRGPDGRPIAGIEMFRDVTALRKMERALEERRSLHGIVGQSQAMQGLYDLIEQVAPYELPVLITGESGVGKERFSDAVQYLSDRSDGAYVKVNCAAINPALIESELFGHRKGAFTGASGDRGGRFEEAHRGTILLDEVGDLPLDLQPKLLRVLQQGEIQRVGEDRPRHVDVRVIAATNRDIEDAVREGRFREDLYYRLAGVRMHVPPLRDRRDDIPLLADHFLERFEREAERRGRPHKTAGLTEAALDSLTVRGWRGNVRELENVLRLAFIRTPDGSPIDREKVVVPGALEQFAPSTPVRTLAEVEAATIRAAMRSSDGNVSEAASALGINRTTLWRKLKKLDPG